MSPPGPAAALCAAGLLALAGVAAIPAEDSGAGPRDAAPHRAHAPPHIEDEEIANDPELGRGFRVGHSYFVPTDKDATRDETWYQAVVDTQIEPLLAEYWFDSQEKIDSALDRLKENSKPNDGG